MIRFLRRIRRSFLIRGQSRKYMLYALGELALVVLGILIALQINNWNENRKERILEDTFLNRIINDLKKDTLILDDRNDLTDKLITDILRYNNEIYSIQQSEKEFIKLLNSVEYNVDELLLTDITYKELVSTGNLELIKNESLKYKIIEYYRQYDFIASRINELNESNLVLILDALATAPILKYWIKGHPLSKDYLIEKDDIIYNTEDWAFINDHSSAGFKKHEQAGYYYYTKYILTKPMLEELKTLAIDLILAIEAYQEN